MEGLFLRLSGVIKGSFRTGEQDMMNTMGIDQYGRSYHNLGKYPRKELMFRLGAKSATKMYRDVNLLTGETHHTGYVVARKWITLFYIIPWEGA